MVGLQCTGRRYGVSPQEAFGKAAGGRLEGGCWRNAPVLRSSHTVHTMHTNPNHTNTQFGILATRGICTGKTLINNISPSRKKALVDLITE